MLSKKAKKIVHERVRLRQKWIEGKASIDEQNRWHDLFVGLYHAVGCSKVKMQQALEYQHSLENLDG